MSNSAAFKERRLLRFIMNPAMIVVWVTGPWLAWWQGVYMDGWLIVEALRHRDLDERKVF